MIKIEFGDLLYAREDIIGHQVNCQGKMGSGVAKQIKAMHPMVFNQYLQYLKSLDNREEALGTVNYAVGRGGKIIANMFGQYDYGYDGNQYTKLNHLDSCLSDLRRQAEANGKLSVALPYLLGSDRGGADWKEVEQLILSVFNGYEVTLYKK